MSVIIVYDSKYGTTQRCARLLAERIGEETTLADMNADPQPDLVPHDVVLIGAPIYGGSVRSRVTRFCQGNRELLLERHVGLYICCLETGERAVAQLEAAFPPWLKAHAYDARSLGGAFRIADLRMLDRFLIRLVGRARGDIERLNMAGIEELAAFTRKARARPRG